MNQEKAESIVLKEYNRDNSLKGNSDEETFKAEKFKCYKCDTSFWFAISEFDDMTTGDMYDCFIGSSLEGEQCHIVYCIECRKMGFVCASHATNDINLNNDNSNSSCDSSEYVCNNCEHLYL